MKKLNTNTVLLIIAIMYMAVTIVQNGFTQNSTPLQVKITRVETRADHLLKLELKADLEKGYLGNYDPEDVANIGSGMRKVLREEWQEKVDRFKEVFGEEIREAK